MMLGKEIGGGGGDDDEMAVVVRAQTKLTSPPAILHILTQMDPQEQPPSADDVAHFEHVARTTLNAINTRDFSITSPAWASCAPNFRAERGGMRSNQQSRSVDLQGLLDDLKELTAKSPNYYVELNECSLHPGSTGQSALLYMPHTVSGDPPGLIMSVMGLMSFERIEGEWKFVRYWATMGPPVDKMAQV